MINYYIGCFCSFFPFLRSNVPDKVSLTEVMCAIFYMRQTSGMCAGVHVQLHASNGKDCLLLRREDLSLRRRPT